MNRLKRIAFGWKESIVRLSAFATAALMVASIISISAISILVTKPQHTKAAAGDMMLFWDGGSAPSGWSIVSTYDGKMPRGEAAANFGTTGGYSTHSHTNQSVSISNASLQAATGLSLSSRASDTHTHSAPSVSSITTASNEPATRTLKLIRYNSGIPATIPAGAIAMFDDSPGLPGSGWTRQSSFDGRVIKVDSTAGTNAGSDTHTHDVTWSGSLGASSGSGINNCFFCSSGTQAANDNHTHTAPGTTTSTSVSNVPPYVQPILAKADADVTTSTVGLTAMFEGSPGDLWTSRSESGGVYYKKFLRPGSTYSSGGGADNHTHTATGTSGEASGWSNNAGGGGLARRQHTHQVTANFYAGSSDPNYTGDNDYFLPPYFDVVIAERVTLSLNSYRWYEDNDLEAVTDPWSALDVPINNMIPALPAGYRPPDAANELRLRIKILLGNQPLYAGDLALKLQYKAGTDSSCTSGSWTDVGAGGSGSIWRFATSGVTDNTTLTTSVLTSTVKELYSKSNPTDVNPNAASVGETVEYDFHIENNGATPAKQYSFRITEGDGSILSDYAQCPTLVTSPQTDNQLRHGDFFQDGVEKGFFWAD